MSSFDRRDFLRSSALLAGLASSGALNAQEKTEPAPSTGRGNPMERLNIAVIGFRGQGRSHISGYAGRHNCVVTHVCDVDTATPQIPSVRDTLAAATKTQGIEPRYVQDLRRIMDDKTIHAVSIATPNHWHALAAIWAMQAGKDVYVEKPVSHNVWEGRRIVDAARHYNRICQTGTQIRSQGGSIEAIDFLKSGKLGKITVARGLCYKPRGSIGKTTGETAPPQTVDYDLWCGPAPRRPLHRARLHYDWHWVWDTGNGDLGNQGIHQMDVARWGLGKNELPKSAYSLGGRFGYSDDGETANTQVCVFDYGDTPLIFEVRGLRTDKFHNVGVGNVFHCTDGLLAFTAYDEAVATDLKGQVLQRFKASGDHFGNFISAVRSRRRQDLHADIEQGHLSSALCHLANISYRLGRPAPFNPRTRAVEGDSVATETLTRTEEHLRANMVALDKTELIVGRKLELKNGAERFKSDEEANRMLTREYREGFVVPARF